jgi:hypothetical protein
MKNDILAILKYLIRLTWSLGFVDNPLEDVVEGKPLIYRWVKNPYKNRWFADPFLLDVTDEEYIVLVEDFEFSKGYACISRLRIDRKSMEIVDAKKIMDDGSHMSFPVILRKEDGIYVHPENSASGQLKLYRYDDTEEKLVFHSVMAELPLTDAVTFKNDGESTMFATRAGHNPNGDLLDILEKRNGQYKIVGTCRMEGNIARMAGNFFEYKGKLYRPAQDCNERYGGATILQEVEFNGKELKVIRNVRRLVTTHPKLRLGLHTFNIYKDTIIVDIYGYSGNHQISEFINKWRFLFLGK